jgi:NADPH-dependent 2,4-dienoyl-CoA reductase/sulfur reductase-like enzyme
MERTRYLIVGGGMTADAACRGIREGDPDGKIVLVAEEPHPPYARPPLSKALWKGDNESTIWLGTEALRVDLRTDRKIVGLDPEKRTATDSKGETLKYERILFATGGRPRRLPFGGDDIVYFRSLDDYRRLRETAEGGAKYLVIGGGFIGSEIAAALSMNGRAVTMVFPDDAVGARIFPRDLAASITDYYRGRGVEVVAGASVIRLDRSAGKLSATLSNGRTVEADTVVAGIGIEPNVELASSAGFPVANGIVVDAHGRVGGREDVFAAGDVARFPVPALDGEMRVEHEDHAKTHGRIVGANMAGAHQPYDHLPFFYSDLFDLGYEAVGELDSRLQTIADWSEPGREGIVYYLDDERRPRGILLWNLFDQVEAARDLIRAAEPLELRALRERVG